MTNVTIKNIELNPFVLKRLFFLSFYYSTDIKMADESLNISTESFDESELINNDINMKFTHAISDIFFTDPDTGEKIMVARAGEELPIAQTKLKKKSHWNYAYKFRYFVGPSQLTRVINLKLLVLQIPSKFLFYQKLAYQYILQ